MNIAVISPHCGSTGSTTVASLIALELTSRGGKKVCLTHTSTKSPSILKYFGLTDEEEDKTANPSRLVKMLKENILKKEDISEYCRIINSQLDVFSANDSKFKGEDMMYALNYILSSFPHEYVVFDIDNKDFENEANRAVLSKTDFVVVVLTQSYMEALEFRRNVKSIEKLIGNKPMCVVVNKYNSITGKIGDLAYEIGSKGLKKSSSWIELRYNPYIVRYCNTGKIEELYREMKMGEYRVMEVHSDLKNICNRIMKYKASTRSVVRKGDASDKKGLAEYSEEEKIKVAKDKEEKALEAKRREEEKRAQSLEKKRSLFGRKKETESSEVEKEGNSEGEEATS